jgi:CheY-like chemotaxis protein
MNPSFSLLPVILVVDDDPGVLQQMVSGLAGLNCSPVGVASHMAAVETLRSNPSIDLVLTDIRLGLQGDDKSGVDLARYVRRQFCDLPIVGYSAVFTESQFASGERGLFDYVWPKGANYREIDAMMNYCRDRAYTHQRLRNEQDAHMPSSHSRDPPYEGGIPSRVTQIIHASRVQIAGGHMQNVSTYEDLLDRLSDILEQVDNVTPVAREEARGLLDKLRSASGEAAIEAASTSGGALLGSLLKQLLGLP